MPYERDDEEDEDWQEDADDDGYLSCPHCGATMLEDAEHCPGCNRWITSEDLPAAQRPWWIIALVLILAGVMILAALPF